MKERETSRFLMYLGKDEIAQKHKFHEFLLREMYFPTWNVCLCYEDRIMPLIIAFYLYTVYGTKFTVSTLKIMLFLFMTSEMINKSNE